MSQLNMKILIVDDIPTMRRLLKMQFEKLGVTDITQAADGAEAWNLIENASPPFQIIISDWSMHVCTGIDLLKRVRSSQTTKNIPFILVTAEGEKESVLEAMKAGVTDYVVKPFDPAALVAKFQKYLEGDFKIGG